MLKSLLSLCFFLSTGTAPDFTSRSPSENPRNAEYWAPRLGLPIQTFQQYSDLLDRFEKQFAPMFARDGETFKIQRFWHVRMFGLSVDKIENENLFYITGSVLRHGYMNTEALALMLCHELGHLRGGAPLYTGSNSHFPLTSGGQADYFATAKCLPRFYTDEEQLEYAENNEIHPFVEKKCTEQFQDQPVKRAGCMRSAMAAWHGRGLFVDDGPVSFETPAPKIVIQTSDQHVYDQCRLDTFFRGALCDADPNAEFSYNDQSTAACLGTNLGARPKCWYREQN